MRKAGKAMISKSLTKELVELTTALVAQPSVTGTPGEADLANQVQKWFMTLPYFQDHPENLWIQDVPDDELGRKNVFALVRGTKGRSGNAGSGTILFHSHMDTVGIQDYGSLQDLAFDTRQLKLALADITTDETLLEHLKSEDWLFGRGALDMKSGLAVQMKVIEYWSNRTEELPGNLLMMANPSEETHHGGMLASLSELLRLREELGLEYLCAVNSDYVTALYPGDPMRYIYTGTTGKLLLNVYIRGLETHVGQAFAGLDPILVLAELLREFNYNTEWVEQVQGEATQPPVALHVRDCKQSYNVQTTGSAVAYWNWFTLDASPLQVLAKAKDGAERAVARALENRNDHAARQIQLLGYGASTRQRAVEENAIQMPVFTFAQWLEQLNEQTRIKVYKVLADEYSELSAQLDARQVVQVMLERALEAAESSDPILLLYFTPPFLPHNYIDGGTQRGEALLSALRKAADEVSLEFGEPFSFQRYFPYLSDSSFLRLMIGESEIDGFIQNCPGWGNLFELPLKKSKALDIPALNLGVYGFDAHKPTERLHIPYSFGILPELINRSIVRILAECQPELD